MTDLKERFIRKIGRRKRAVAQVHVTQNGSGKIIVNGKDYTEYFPMKEYQEIITSPMTSVGQENIDVSVKVAGGGMRGQAEGVRLGIARALVEIDEEVRVSLKKLGYLKRDPRRKERKKFGLRKARRAPQFSKR